MGVFAGLATTFDLAAGRTINSVLSERTLSSGGFTKMEVNPAWSGTNSKSAMLCPCLIQTVCDLESPDADLSKISYAPSCLAGTGWPSTLSNAMDACDLAPTFVSPIDLNSTLAGSPAFATP